MSDYLDATPVVTGSVANPTAFEKGGTLLLGSFKPGPGAEADEETDQLSLGLVKGIKDVLPKGNTHFTIVNDDSKSSDYFLEGYIEDYGRDRHLTGLKLRKNQVHLSVDGDISSEETGEKIVLFQTSIVINLKTQNPKSVAYQIGCAIAQFIASPKAQGE